MSKQFAVIGLGRFGFEVALWLSQHHFQTLAIDVNRNLVQEISKDVDNAMCFDSTNESALRDARIDEIDTVSTNESALRDARIDEIDTVICAIGDHHVQNNILTTALLKQFGVPRIVARASTDLTAQKVATPGLTELIPLSDNAAIAELKVPESFIGKNIYDLRIRSRYGINVIGIRRLKENLADEIDKDDKESRNFILSFSPEDIFEKDDVR